MFLTDRVAVTNTRRTADGYLVAEAHVARTGIQEYLASELGMTDRDPNSIVRVYRAPEEVFSDETMHSFAFRPMTLGHPRKMVTADTWKAVSIGQTGGDVQQDGKLVRVPLVMMDAAAIKAYEDGTRELSMGYSAEIVFKDGVTPEGEQYDAIQTQIKNNHLALVDRARGGNQLRIGDDNQRKPTMSDIKTRTVLVDGLSVETTDAGAQAISKLQGDLASSHTKLSDAETAHKAAIAAKDGELAKKDAEIDSLKGKVLTDAALDAKVKERADLMTTAKAIADQDYTGKSADDIRKSAVVAKLGDAAIKDKSAEYIAARFDILAEDAKADPVRKHLAGGGTTRTVNDNGYGEMVKRMNDPNYKPADGGAH